MMGKLNNRFCLGVLAACILLSGCQPDSGGNGATGSGSASTSSAVALAEIGKTADGWYQVYDQALAQAKTSGKPMLIDFTGSDWCGWCIKLDQEVFSTSEFKQWAQEHVVLLKLDFPKNSPQPASLKQQNAELHDKFQVRGYPSVLFIDSNGNQIGQYGYEAGGPAVWTKKASEILGG